MRIISTFIFAALLFLSPLAFADSHIQTAEQELIAFNDQYNEFISAYDIDGFLSLYSEEVLWIAPESPAVQGHDVPRGTFQFLIDNEGSVKHTIDTLFVSDDGTQATMIGETHIVVEKAGLDVTGTYLFVLERNGTDWIIITDMYNQYAPAQEE